MTHSLLTNDDLPADAPVGGFIKISRDFFASDPFWAEAREYSRAEAWIDIVQTAAWRARRYQTTGGLDHLERGEVVFSLRFLTRRWQWSKGKVERYMESLLAAGHLAVARAGQHGTVYRIIRYNDYQGTPRADQQAASRAKQRDIRVQNAGHPAGRVVGHLAGAEVVEASDDSTATPAGAGHPARHLAGQKRDTPRDKDQEEAGREDQLLSGSSRRDDLEAAHQTTLPLGAETPAEKTASAPRSAVAPAVIDAAIAAIRAAYPTRQGGQNWAAARISIERIVRAGVATPDQLAEAARAYAAVRAGENQQYTKAAAKFFETKGTTLDGLYGEFIPALDSSGKPIPPKACAESAATWDCLL